MAEDNNLDLLPLLNLIRGIQAAGSTLAPEPQPDLPNGYSPEQAQRWIVWRNAKIQAAQVPQPVKDKMIASEDVGEDEPMPQPQSQAVRDAMEAEARARAGRRPGTPSTTGAPPQPGRDLPLEFGLQPDNSWGFSKTPPPEPRPAVQQIGYVAPGAVPRDQLAPGPWGSTEDQTSSVTLGNIFNATGDKQMEIPVGNPSSLERGALGVPPGAVQPISEATSPRMSGFTDQGFIPTTAINLHHDIAPQVPEGAARPFAPGEAVQNPNGGWSSEISTTIEHPTQPGKWALVPSLWLKDGKPYVVHNSDEAADLARASGLQWPAYDTSDAADAVADAREQKWQSMTTEQARSVDPLWTVQPTTKTLLQQQSSPQTLRGQQLLQLLPPSNPQDMKQLLPQAVAPDVTHDFSKDNLGTYLQDLTTSKPQKKDSP